MNKENEINHKYKEKFKVVKNCITEIINDLAQSQIILRMELYVYKANIYKANDS